MRSQPFSFPLVFQLLVFFFVPVAFGAGGAGFHARLVRDPAGDLRLAWPMEEGRRYFVETSADLVDWIALPDGVVGAATEGSRVVLGSGAGMQGRRFWRVSAFDVAIAPPSVAVPLAERTVAAGFTAKFAPNIFGAGPLAYQWSRNGTAIAGATASTFTTAPLTAADDGAVFTVTVRNAGGVVTSSAMVLHVQPSPLPVGLWTFDDPSAPYASLFGPALNVTGSPTRSSGAGAGDGAITLAAGDLLGIDHGIAANGGGTRVNRWTVLMDLRVPAFGGFNSLLQTTPANTDDGDLFLNSSGRLGIGTAGYSAVGLDVDRWYRLALVVDNGNRYDVYLDGAPVLRGTAGVLDGRFALLSRLLLFADEDGERRPLDLSQLALFDRALSDAEVAALGGFSPADSALLTLPYLQNVKTDGVTLMWETDRLVVDTVEFGATTAYGTAQVSVPASTAAGTVVHKAVVTGLMPDTTYHYRVHSSGAVTTDQTFRTAPAATVDFSFGVWGDSQGSTDNPADRDEPTKSFLRHMVETEHVDLALTTGDLAESGNSASMVWTYFVDRPVRIVGARVPFYVAWGNHDGGAGSLIRSYVDLPSKDRAGKDAGNGSYSFDYAGCHFLCIDYFTAGEDVAGWVREDLASDAAKAARFIFAFIHTPPWCERWNTGNSELRTSLVPYLEQAGVAVLFSGHMHGYERGLRNDVYYVTTGGGSWLDTAEPLVYDWPHITVGGFSNEPSAINHGLVNQYMKVEVVGRTCTVKMMAFNLDGSFRGVLDTFQITKPEGS